MAATIVCAYLAKNMVAPGDLPGLIREIYGALRAVSFNSTGAAQEFRPAVPANRSIAASYLVCLACGVKLKSLKRHLGRRHDLASDEYRVRFALPHDYPMVAPNYAAARSKLAIGMGLGRKRRT
jgi:predicted transcriptional regulator